jgi:hypothetical protein
VLLADAVAVVMTAVVLFTLVQPFKVTVSVYTPPFAKVTFEMVGF